MVWAQVDANRTDGHKPYIDDFRGLQDRGIGVLDAVHGDEAVALGLSAGLVLDEVHLLHLSELAEQGEEGISGGGLSEPAHENLARCLRSGARTTVRNTTRHPLGHAADAHHIHAGRVVDLVEGSWDRRSPAPRKRQGTREFSLRKAEIMQEAHRTGPPGCR